MAETERPTLISLKTVIGYGSPPRRHPRRAQRPDGRGDGARDQGGARLGSGVEVLRPQRGLGPLRPARRRGCRKQDAWQARVDAWKAANPELASEWDDALAAGARSRASRRRSRCSRPITPAISTRKAASEVMQAFGPFVPTMVGGAADLVHSTFTEFEDDKEDWYTPSHAGRNVAWGVREHGMGAAVNGLALHGGIVKPFGSTFFVFTDYMRPPIRLSALMGLDVVWIFSHDSVAVGEDGPTHQPIEHLAAMRAIPNLTVIRPADANELSEAWAAILEELKGPVCLVLSRQNVPVVDRDGLGAASGLRRGAYVLADADSPDVVLVATGAEVSHRARCARAARRAGRPGEGRLDALMGAVRGAERRLPGRGAAARRDEDLGRGRHDVRLGPLGRRVDRHRQLRRLGQGRRRCSSTSGSARPRSPSRSRPRSPSSLRLEGQRRFHPGRGGRGPGRDRRSTSCVRPR